MSASFFKKRRRRLLLLFLAGCVLSVILLALLWPRDREPRYKGKKLSEWADIYETSFHPEDVDGDAPKDSAERREAVEAAHRMRDKLLPHALAMIAYQKPQWKNRVEHFMESRLNVRRWCPLFVWSPFYGDRGEDNLVYFQMLGPDASATVPELVRIMNHAEATRIRERAMYALSRIGKEGLRPLMEVAGDPQNPDRRRAAYAILGMKDLGPILGPAVPLLVKSLDDPDRNVSTAGAMILGELAIEPDISVPALTSCLRNTDEYLRQEAAEALAKFGGKARSAVPTLVSTLDDSDFNVRDAATNALLTISPESLPKAGAEN